MAAALVALCAWIVLALNVSFAAGTGIECGWQPMPDGSASYECIVQVAPELLNSLRRGDSIPLTVDVPQHIRPISRIRLVAGNELVPHQTLAKNLRLWPEAEKKPRAGVVETQFTTNSNDPRYSNQQATNGAVVPLNDYMSSAQDSFARQLQNGGQAVREAVGQVTQDVLPPDPGRSVANAIDRAGNDLGNNLRSASDSVQNDIRQLFGNQAAVGNGSEILPPDGRQTSAPNFQQTQPILPNQGNNTATNKRLDQPMNFTPGNTWQSSQPQSNSANGNPISPPSSFDNQRAGDTRTQSQPSAGNDFTAAPVGDRYENAPPFAGGRATILPQNNSPARSNPVDPYGNAGQIGSDGLPSADSRNGALGINAQSASSGPSFPPFTPSVGSEQSQITPTPVASSSTPEIRRDMLNQPPSADIQGANGLPIGQQPITGAQVATQAPTAHPASAANSFNWATNPQPQQTAALQTAGTAGATTNSVAPLLLSWVLLSGSGAGNLYLFWSYLDVRNKYRDLVDDAARRISGRRVRD
jgi:hypothetical protein